MNSCGSLNLQRGLFKVKQNPSDLKSKSPQKLSKRQHENVVVITLSFVSLGDLRARWKLHRYDLPPTLLAKVPHFRRIKLEQDKPLCIRGSDNGLLVYGVHINKPSVVHDLYESIQVLPEPK